MNAIKSLHMNTHNGFQLNTFEDTYMDSNFFDLANKCFCPLQGQPAPRKKNHRRSDRMQDLVDLGDGYDETDPFVDNSEAVS